MRLRTLFEGLGQEVAIIFGRFNPPHKGHRAAWELASKSAVWVVGTNQSTVGPKDPLPYNVKVEAMKTVWPEVEGHIMAETGWLTMASKMYEKYPDATLLCFTDEDWVTKTIQQYNGKEGTHGYYNFKKIEQRPTPRLSSATALRDAVVKGDRDAFTSAAGVDADTEVAGQPFFDLVSEYLMPYQNAPKKTTKKKVAEPAEGVAEGWKQNLAALGVAGVMGLSGAAAAADKTDQVPMTAVVVIDGETKKLDLTPKGFNDVRDAEKWLAKFMKDRGIMDWQGKIERGTPGSGQYQRVRITGAGGLESMQEAPIEINPDDPMDPMIYGTGANPGSLKYRMLRASKQMQDLSKRAENADAGEWDLITRQFQELQMNVDQIRHGLDELKKLRSRGGTRSRGIEKF